MTRLLNTTRHTTGLTRVHMQAVGSCVPTTRTPLATVCLRSRATLHRLRVAAVRGTRLILDHHLEPPTHLRRRRRLATLVTSRPHLQLSNSGGGGGAGLVSRVPYLRASIACASRLRTSFGTAPLSLVIAYHSHTPARSGRTASHSRCMQPIVGAAVGLGSSEKLAIGFRGHVDLIRWHTGHPRQARAHRIGSETKTERA